VTLARRSSGRAPARCVAADDLEPFSTPRSIEANEEKADALNQQTVGVDQVQMQGYQDRSKYREVVGTKFARELVLK